MGGGDTHPGFPHPNPTVSYWQIPPHPISERRTTPELPTSETFDYAIVGSGVSGAATAFKLLSRDPSLKILMLEARTAASAASGRNGGHCRAGWWLHFATYAAVFGEEQALKFERFEEETVRDIEDFVCRYRPDNDFRNVETADVHMTEAGWAATLEVMRIREEVRRRTPGDDGPLTKRTVWAGQAARKHMGMSNIVGAVTYPGHTQNPYRLVCKMLELSVEKGLNLQTNTPALAIRPASAAYAAATPAVTENSPPSTTDSGGPSAARWLIETERGTVRARTVVLATNAYTNTLHPGLAATGFLTPARSQVAAIRPGSAIAGDPALRRSGGPVDVETGDYYMTRPEGTEGEGDVLWGGGRCISRSREVGVTDDSEVNEEIAAYLRRAPAALYGRDRWGEEGRHVRDWTGITCYTPDTFPLVGEAPGQEGLWMTVGMNGHGMAMAFRCAEALVEMMVSGEEPEWFPTPLRLARAWAPPKLCVEIDGRVV